MEKTVKDASEIAKGLNVLKWWNETATDEDKKAVIDAYCDIHESKFDFNENTSDFFKELVREVRAGVDTRKEAECAFNRAIECFNNKWCDWYQTEVTYTDVMYESGDYYIKHVQYIDGSYVTINPAPERSAVVFIKGKGRFVYDDLGGCFRWKDDNGDVNDEELIHYLDNIKFTVKLNYGAECRDIDWLVDYVSTKWLKAA